MHLPPYGSAHLPTIVIDDLIDGSSALGPLAAPERMMCESSWT
jgi:hypothetical protein